MESNHPDLLGCNVYCVGDEHATTVASARLTAAAVLEDLRRPYAQRGFAVVSVTACEMPPDIWWAQHEHKGSFVSGDIVNVIDTPQNLTALTVWRVRVRAREE